MLKIKTNKGYLDLGGDFTVQLSLIHIYRKSPAFPGAYSYDPGSSGRADNTCYHPELNASAVARRMGISQSLMSQYISGIKKPSQERELSLIHI